MVLHASSRDRRFRKAADFLRALLRIATRTAAVVLVGFVASDWNCALQVDSLHDVLQSLQPRRCPDTLGSGHPDNRYPRLRLAVYAADCAAHPRAERLLRGAAVHGAAGGDQGLPTARRDSVGRPFLGLRCGRSGGRCGRAQDGRAGAGHLLWAALHRASHGRQGKAGRAA
jgi:hypothetical protein